MPMRELQVTVFAVLALACATPVQAQGAYGIGRAATPAEIQEFCQATYDVTFPVFSKVDVNGPDADPLYEYLRAAAPGDFGPDYGDFYQAISKIRPGSDGTDEVKWNFTKFLIGRDGTVIKRYEPPVPPADIASDLENYL